MQEQNREKVQEETIQNVDKMTISNQALKIYNGSSSDDEDTGYAGDDTTGSLPYDPIHETERWKPGKDKPVSLKVPAFSQRDYKGTWLYDNGCAVTAAAMVFKYYGVNTDPKSLGGTPGVVDGKKNINWANAATKAGGGKINTPIVLTGGNDASILGKAADCLKQGVPSIIQFKGKDYSHFVVVVGVHGDGKKASDFDVIDPGRSDKKVVHLDQTKSYQKSYHLNKIIIYRKK